MVYKLISNTLAPTRHIILLTLLFCGLHNYTIIPNICLQVYFSLFDVIQLYSSIILRGDYMYFKRLEDLRVDHDLTQKQIADHLGIQREVYRRYEKGTHTIPIDYLIKLADLYKTSVDFIIGRTIRKL